MRAGMTHALCKLRSGISTSQHTVRDTELAPRGPLRAGMTTAKSYWPQRRSSG
jgi:hypothetical protein